MRPKKITVTIDFDDGVSTTTLDFDNPKGLNNAFGGITSFSTLLRNMCKGFKDVVIPAMESAWVPKEGE